MCGIFGSISLDGSTRDRAALVNEGIKLLRHRGPDGFGVEGQGPVSFGHARLSIIDLEGGHQPMWSADRSAVISYNGEVYNFAEVRDRLARLGYRFNTRSDTEVVLNAFLEWGDECLQRLRGMFAFAAFDFRKNKALIARDRLGEKPLFYTVKDDALYFSSELEPLYRTVGPFKLDMCSLDDYLSWQYIHAPKTIYRGVESLLPAHCLKLDLSGPPHEPRQERYWKLQFKEDHSLSIDDWERRLDGLVREAVGMRLVSDVPFGAFLSGGIDSSIVVKYMADIMDRPVKTFSIGFKEADFSELKYAEQVAGINGTEHHTEIVEADSLGLLPLLARHYGQPFADSSAIPTYYVSRMGRQHVKMVLSGDGGDENFAGYHSYEYVLRKINGEFAEQEVSLDKRILRAVGFTFLRKFTNLLSGSCVDKAYDYHCHTAYHFPPDDRRRLFKKEYRSFVADLNRARRSLMDMGDEPLISRLQNLDIMAYLPFDILTKVDIASMANSLEVRVPLLDHVLVETAAAIPAEFKLKEEKAKKTLEFDKKHILKRLAKRHYPAELIDRRKMGFGVPVGKWFAGELAPVVRKRLLDSRYMPEFFEMDEVRRLLDSHSTESDYSTRIWNLLFLEEWMRGHSEAL